MAQAIQFAILGLGAGAAYTLLAQGIVLIYRGSGIVNFAHAEFLMIGMFAARHAVSNAAIFFSASGLLRGPHLGWSAASCTSTTIRTVSEGRRGIEG